MKNIFFEFIIPLLIILIAFFIGVFAGRYEEPQTLSATLSQRQTTVPAIIMEHDTNEDGTVDYEATYVFNGEKLIEVKRVNKK